MGRRLAGQVAGHVPAADEQKDGDRRPGDGRHMVQRAKQTHNAGRLLLPRLQLAAQECAVVVVYVRQFAVCGFHAGQKVLSRHAAEHAEQAGPERVVAHLGQAA